MYSMMMDLVLDSLSGDDEFEVYSEFKPMPDEKRFIKSVCSSFKKESGLLEYLADKGKKKT